MPADPDPDWLPLSIREALRMVSEECPEHAETLRGFILRGNAMLRQATTSAESARADARAAERRARRAEAVVEAVRERRSATSEMPTLTSGSS